MTLTKKINIIQTIFWALIFSISFSQSLRAAVSTDVRDTAGAEEARFEKESQLEAKAREIRKDVQKTEEEKKPVAARKTGKAFVLKSVQITGNEALTKEELEAQAKPWIGKKVTFADLQELSSALKQYYRDKKFIAAYIYIPPQKVKNGAVQVSVIEGKLGQVTVEGNKWFSEKTIRRAVHLKEGEVVYFQDLNTGLTYVNKNPDIKARAALKPGKDPKSTDIVLKVKDKFPLHLNGDINNLGTDNTGKTRYGVGITHNNLLGLMDQVSARFQIGSGAWAVGTSYRVPVGPYRTQVGFSYSHSRVDLGGDFKDLNIRGKATTYGVEVVQPIYRNSFLDTSLNLGFDIKSVENRILGIKAGKDELRILNMGVNFEQNDRWGKTYNPHSFHIGFADFLGSSNKMESAASRANTGGQFFIYRSSLIRYNRLPLGLLHTLRGEMQLTNDRLAPSEQFRLGGAFSVRGYAEGDYLSDYGAFVTNEIAIPSYFFPKSWVVPFTGESLQQAIQGVGFFDLGGGSLRKPLVGEREEKMLAGAGGGVKIHLYDRLYGRFQWAGRIGNKAADGNNSAFYYGISAET